MGMYRHDALPKNGTLRTENGGKPTDGRTPAHYPLLATCNSCNRQIRLSAYQGSGWKHVAAPRAAKTADHAEPTEDGNPAT